MPHIDELQGAATVAAAGMFAAIAVQPLTTRDTPGELTGPPVAASLPRVGAASMVRLPAIEVVAQRSVELPRIAGAGKFAPPHLTRSAARPRA